MFFDKIIENIDIADKNNLQSAIQRIARERAFFEMVFNAITEGIVVIGSDLKIQYANPSAKRIIGIPDHYLEQSITRFFRDLDIEKMKDEKDGWNKNIRLEVEILYPVKRLLLFYLVPLGAESDSATIMLHDITESREKTDDIIESEKMHMISLLAAGVAHEIGNPLNSLNIHLQLLKRILEKDDIDKSEAIELLSIATAEVERLDKIINQFLDAVRSSKPILSKLDIKPLLIETLKSLKHDIEDKNINVDCSWSEILPTILGDDNQLKQAFYNIIKNSIQAMSTNGELKIICDFDDDSLRISFIDNGSGIKHQNLSNVFEPYYTEKKDGHGLGLMVVERIIREHGAELSINSEPNKKTVFLIRFPRSTKKTKLLM